MVGRHHRGKHPAAAKALTSRADRDPTARCRRCGNVKSECGPNGDGRGANGRPIRWTAGHIIAGQIDGALQLECSYCNYSDGQARSRQREPKSDDWW